MGTVNLFLVFRSNSSFTRADVVIRHFPERKIKIVTRKVIIMTNDVCSANT